MSPLMSAQVLTDTRMVEHVFDMTACLARVRQRDEAAARELMQELHPLVLKLVRSHLPRRTSEEDLTQTVFMKIFANLGQYSGTVPLQHWVSRIAINTCINELKAERIRPELRWADLTEAEAEVLEAITASDDELSPGESLGARELAEKLLATLDPKDRLVVRLLHLEGKSVEDVKQVTGWGASLIKVRAFRARLKLRKHFARLTRQERS